MDEGLIILLIGQLFMLGIVLVAQIDENRKFKKHYNKIMTKLDKIEQGKDTPTEETRDE